MKAALYVRVSTAHQIDKDSLPFQREELINYAKYALNIDNYEVFEDAGYSAKNTVRPAYQDMMRRMRDGEFTHMIVWKIDRISKNLRDFTEMYDELKDYGVTFVSKNEQFDTSSAMGEAMVQIILVFAELERKLTAERVFSIMMNRAEKGLWNGAKSPFGYKWSAEDNYPVPCDKEGPVVETIYNMYSKTESALEVSRYLNNNGIDTKRGGRWTSKTIVDIIRSPFYKGTLRYNYRQGGRGKKKPESEWIILDNNHSPLISKELWEKANSIMNKNSESISANSRKRVNVHIFSGILKCGKCGSSFVSGLDRARKDGFAPSIYRCRHRSQDKLCDASNPGEVKFGPFVLQYLGNFIKAKNTLSKNNSMLDLQKSLLSGDVFDGVEFIERKGLEDTYKAILGLEYIEEASIPIDLDTASMENAELNRLKSEKSKYDRALKRLHDLFLFSDNIMSEKDFISRKGELESRLNDIDAKIIELETTTEDEIKITDVSFLQKSGPILFSSGIFKDEVFDYKKVLTAIGKEPIKELIKSTIENIVLLDGVVTSITFVNGLVHNFKYIESEKV